MPIEHGMHGANGGQADAKIQAPELLADLRSSPTRMFLLVPEDQVLDLKGQAVRLPIRPAGSIRQAFQTTALIAREDLVTGLARDTEFPAKLRHLLAFEQPSHKPQSFIHLATLPPRHLRLPTQMPESVTYVPGTTCNLSALKGTQELFLPLRGCALRSMR